MLFENFEKLDYSKVIQTTNILEKTKKEWTSVRIAILRNITIEPIIPYLKFFCFDEGLKADIYLGDYDNVMQDILNAKSPLYKHKPEIIILCLKVEILSEKLAKYFTNLNSNELNKEVEYLVDYIEQTIQIIKKNSNAIVLIHNFEVPVFSSLGILDYQDNFGHISTYRKINYELIKLVNKHENTFVVDMDLLQSIVGYDRFIDNRYWHIGRLPYTREGLELIAREYIKFIRSHKSRNRKCLVLDCDNTLWGGIIGEDGIENIKIGKTYPGSAYETFQQAILNLYNRGIILAICSKNNMEDVKDVLRNHPDMVLREEHFASMIINWDDKVTNLKKIADELNISLDSIVFIDDNEFEINMVRNYLPDIKVILLPRDPTKYSDTLNVSGLFDSLIFSEEDKQRNQMYKTEVMRKKLKIKAANLEDYFKSLEMELTFYNANDFYAPRIAQLTNRTNQFNLTTKRYSESDIKEFLNRKDYDVLCLRLIDRFGDAGIIGVAILKYNESNAEIDTFLLSCRVLGRCIEDVLLRECLLRAKRNMKTKIYGYYIETKKNQQVSKFYQKKGFILEHQNEDETKYCFQIDKPVSRIPQYFKLIHE